MAEHYASGNWHVTKGKEKDFVEAWTEFLQWTRKDFPAMVQASLIQATEDGGHFVSISEWEDTASRDSWKNSPEFAKKFGAARALCDEMSSIDGERRVTV